MSFNHKSICVIACVVCMSLVSCGYDPSYDPRKAPISNAKIIIQALDAYRNSTGEYPVELDQLIPDYLESIPDPQWGTNEWEYNRANWDLYSIEIRRSENWYEGYYYDSSTDSWGYDQ